MSITRRPERVSELVLIVLALVVLVGGIIYMQNSMTGRSVSQVAGSAPAVSLVAPGITNLTVSDITFICNATSTNLSNITLYTNISGSWLPGMTKNASGVSAELQVNMSSVSDGIYAWNCLAYDLSGYSASAPQNRTFRLDATPPALELAESPPGPSTYSPVINYIFNASVGDDVSGIDSVWFVFAGANQAIVSNGSEYSFSTGSLSAGTYTYTWNANDTLGNLNSDTQEYIVLKEDSSIALAVNGSSGAQTVEYGSIVNITAGLVEGEAGISLYIDNLLVSSGTLSIQHSLLLNRTGIWNITVVYPGTENFSASRQEIFVFVIDRNSSFVHLAGPSDGFRTGSSNITLFCNATSGNLSYITLYTNTSGAWLPEKTAEVNATPALFGFNFTNLADSTYAWNCLAFDLGTNRTLASQDRRFTVDLTPPVWDHNLSNYTINYSVQFRYDLNASDSSGVGAYSINDSRFYSDPSDGTVSNVTELGLGVYHLNVSVDDAVGNSLSGVVVVTVVDHVLPTVSLVSPADDYVTDGAELSLNCSAEDRNVSNITLYTNVSGSWMPYDATYFSNSSGSAGFILAHLTQHTFVWNCLAADTSGNRGFASSNWTVQVSGGQPSGPSGGGSGGGGGASGDDGSCAGMSCPAYCEGSFKKYDGRCFEIAGKGVCRYLSGYCTSGCDDGACLSDPCSDVVCSPKDIMCWDGTNSSCTPKCSGGVCGTCMPECPGDEAEAIQRVATSMGIDRSGDVQEKPVERAVACGDGVCGEAEDSGTCPVDCKVEETATALGRYSLSLLLAAVLFLVLISAYSVYTVLRENKDYRQSLRIESRSSKDAVELDGFIIEKLATGIPPEEVKKIIVMMGWPEKIVDYYVDKSKIKRKASVGTRNKMDRHKHRKH